MPIYEYRCEACDYHFEKLQKISDDALVECPSCHAPKLKKLISAAGFQLKGTGWYVTDFRDKKGGEKIDKTSLTPTETSKATDKKDKKNNQGSGSD